MLFSQCTISLQKNIKHTDEFWFNEVLCLIIDGRYSTELLEKVKEMAEGIVVEDAPVFKTRDEIVKKQQVCLWTHTNTAYTYSYNDSLCSWISLLRYRVDDQTSHAGSTQTGFNFYHVRLFFFFFNSFTILVFLTLTLPNPLRGVQTSKDIFILSQKNWPFQTFSLFYLCTNSSGVCGSLWAPLLDYFNHSFTFFFLNVFFKCSFKLKMTLVFLSEGQ